MRLAVAAAIAAICAMPASAEPSLQQTVTAFLNAYAAGDKAAVINAVEPNVQLYGSDVSEVYKGAQGASDMFDADVKLWGGAAKFGTMWHVSGARDGRLASIMFDVPFTVAKNPTVTVRFAMVWVLDGGEWKLIQSSNTVPTVGQSASDILKSVH
jgi:ketosteroid isomerase-like protein